MKRVFAILGRAGRHSSMLDRPCAQNFRHSSSCPMDGAHISAANSGNNITKLRATNPSQLGSTKHFGGMS